ncbi:MAG: hypothetical protein ABI144_11325 [Gallionella sp.]
MKQALLLFLSADHLHAQLMAGSKIVLQTNFTDSPNGRENFESLLQTAKCPTYLLTDMIEEDFRHEIVPHLSGNSRAALFQRKFDQFYRGTPFHKATLLKRQTTGRRDDDMLFSALTNPGLIMPWLNIMLAQQTPLEGIYSVPQISEPLVKDHPSKHLLLISWEKFSGLRQTYFSDHRLQISRLTPVHAELTFQDAVVNELSRTYQYLKSLSLLPSGQILDVRILCNMDDRSELQNKLPKDSDVRYDFADIEAVGKQFKLDYHFTDSDASQIFLHQLATSRPNTHYANAEHTRYYTLWQLRRALNWSSVVILIASILWVSTTVLQNNGNASATDALKLQTATLTREAKQITQGFPVTDIPAADMKASVSVMRKLDLYDAAPQAVLQPISATLNHFPKLDINELEWKESATEPVATNTRPDVPAEVITLKGDMPGFGNDYRTALAYLDRFQFELSKLGYQVTALTRPLDVSPTGSLANQSEASENQLGFSFKLVWRPAI